MNPESDQVKSRDFTERRFRFFNLLGFMHVAASFIGLLFLIRVILKNMGDRYFMALAIIPIIHIGLFLIRYLFLFSAGLTDLNNIKTKKLGRFKTCEIKDLFKRLIRDNFSGKDEIPGVFIVKGFGANAFAVNSLFLNLSKRLNNISIGEELFSLLKLNEIEAVALHEIGHFKRNINIGFRIQFIPTIFNILTAYVLTCITAPTLYTYILFFFILRFIWKPPYRYFPHDVEYLSDLYAAEKCGKLSIINGLIKIHRMADIEITINQQVCEFILKNDYLTNNDIERLKQKILKKAGKNLHDPDRLHSIAQTVLGNEKKGIRKSLSKPDLKKRDKALNLYLNNLEKITTDNLIDWNDIDTHRKDGEIDREEYAGFITLIKEHPELQLFRSPNDNIKKMKLQSHPALRQRILFLDKNCPLITAQKEKKRNNNR